MEKLDMNRIEKTMDALRKNYMQAYYCETAGATRE